MTADLMWGKGLPGTALPRAWTQPSESRFPQEPTVLGWEQVLRDRMRTYIFGSYRSSVGALLSLGM